MKRKKEVLSDQIERRSCTSNCRNGKKRAEKDKAEIVKKSSCLEEELSPSKRKEGNQTTKCLKAYWPSANTFFKQAKRSTIADGSRKRII